jgi:hypothetical protein
MPGPVMGQGRRRVRQTGGEILPAHVYRNEEERWCGLLSGSVLFMLMLPPLQSKVIEPYSVQSVWFLSRLLLKETGRIQNFGS